MKIAADWMSSCEMGLIWYNVLDCVFMFVVAGKIYLKDSCGSLINLMTDSLQSTSRLGALGKAMASYPSAVRPFAFHARL